MLTAMGRAERLLDLAELLRASEGTTVLALATELGVSERTLLRDLATLRERGMPITGEPGPGGGVRLESDRGVTAVHLSLAEAASIWLAARLSREASDLPWGEAARSALAKLLGSLPRHKARELRALCRRVYVGPAASAATREGAGTPPPELLGHFEAAFTAGLGLGFHYRDRHGRKSVRRVEPHGLLVQSPLWYVLAHDIDKGEPRMFRMDRIARPRLLAEHRFSPNAAVIEAQLPDDAHLKPLLSR
ncbi:MAG: WYL domain-containing protein [Myxococcales bacterium]|nr:WYL domain-containing protein [Myxococcales bacterium]